MIRLIDVGITAGVIGAILGLFKFTANKLATKQDIGMCNAFHKQLKEDSDRNDKILDKVDKRMDAQHLELVNIGKELALLTQEVKLINK